MGFYLPLVFLNVFAGSLAFPSGAPQSACSSLMPVHKGGQPNAIKVQNSPSPFSVSAVRSGGKIKVTISSPSSTEFQGFILQARLSENRMQMVDGTFTVNTMSKTIDCPGGKQNTLTHVNKNEKSEIVTEWTPSGGIEADIVFRATVAKDYGTFWRDIDSPVIHVSSEEGKTSGMTESSLSMYDGCSRSKGCFGYPSDCIAESNCDVLLSYVKSPDGIRFTLQGSLQPGKYMAMALSTDARMGDDSVTECFVLNSNVVARESWNDGYDNGRTRDLPRGSYMSEYNNGLATCSWTKEYFTETNGMQYNLAQNTYHALLAKGQVTNGRLNRHDGRIASQEPINFTAIEDIEGAGITDSVKIHGTFMVTAWVGFVSLGILLARHFKNTWENSTLCGVKIWFAFHRGFMIAALVLVVIAFIVIFVHKNGWNDKTKNPHAVLGCIATAFGLFQPIMAAFRPSPDHTNRPIFNWLHWMVGNAAQIIAVITIFFAVSLESSGLKESFYWVMAIFVIVHLIFHFLFQVHAWTSSKKKVTELSMNEMNGNGRSNTHNAQNLQGKNVTENVFRILLLGIYSIFLLVIIIALYCLIGVA